MHEKSPLNNITNLYTPEGESLAPAWFDLDNYDLDDWAQQGVGETMRVWRPDDDEGDDLAPLNFA